MCIDDSITTDDDNNSDDYDNNGREPYLAKCRSFYDSNCNSTSYSF